MAIDGCEERELHELEEEQLIRWACGEKHSMSTLDLRSALHAAIRDDDGGAQRELEALIADREDKGGSA